MDATKFSGQSLQIYSQDPSKCIEEAESEQAIRRRTNGTSYQVLRNESFGTQLEIFQGEPFLAATAIDSEGNFTSPHLAKIFQLQYLPKSYRNILMAESSMILHYLSNNSKSFPTLLRMADIFKTKDKLFIFYVNELHEAISLRQLITEHSSINTTNKLDRLMTQLAITIDTLSRHGISHRYIRPEHVFVKRDGTIKVTALEMMCFAWDPKEKKQVLRSKGLHDEQPHQWDHLPPESFRDRYDCTVLDVWSFGVVLSFCLCKETPFTVPHTIEEAACVWNQFKSRADHSPWWTSYLGLLSQIFVPADRRIRSDELVKEYAKRINDGRKSFNQSRGGGPSSRQNPTSPRK